VYAEDSCQSGALAYEGTPSFLPQEHYTFLESDVGRLFDLKAVFGYAHSPVVLMNSSLAN
jgi:hypothetical protein